MRAVTMFRADDGQTFATQEEAEKRDALIAECATVEAIIGKRPKVSGSDCEEHGADRLKRFHAALVGLAMKYLGASCFKGYDGNPESVHPRSIVGRYLDDSDSLRPLNHLWNRRMCIDSRGREFEQPYYAIQSDEGRLP